MKLLLFSDLHRSISSAESLLEIASGVDVIVGAGDFAIQRKGLADTIGVLCQAPCPAVIVPGNGESFDELCDACREWSAVHVLHGSSAIVDGIKFFGLGGGIPTTPFGSWSYDFSEEEAIDLMGSMDAPDVFVTHSPPFEFVDVDSSGQHRGSLEIRRAIELHLPKLVVCGHVHDSWEQSAAIGETTIINAGPRGITFDL